MDNLKNSLKEEIVKIKTQNNAEIYGDNFIGYRMQDRNGAYLDDELGNIYEKFGGVDICEVFNDICFELRVESHNWG